ncbi:aspartyl protease family protein At5g10770-like [Hordeum vulgare subsp. vulgare]|uniref:Peptidase A1 domain-containing protein n=1 Tax=Hordeum vulgare subsp. vulgare TaxID=112509 RepID=M0Y240_HORVV|nr:aspartyl protease family protein At5g10770-like [Hordeum vulgare subsp. vulgare]XP_044957866.1 aspartyl protease family protein At5g10770-like [Hordeum vulgare subsp. vulgare]
MAPLVPLLLLLLLSSFCSTSSSLDLVHGAASVEEELSNYVVVETSSLEPSPVCQGHRVSPPASSNLTGGGWVPLSRPHGPCSSAGDRAAPPSSVAETLRWDEHRVSYIQRKLSGAPLETPQSDQTDTQPASPFGIGGPKGTSDVSPAATGGGGKLPGVTQHMLLDTASDVPWVQCAPCPQPQCYRQTDVTYDPSKSGTYAPFPCSSSVCRQLGPYANGCTGAGNTGQCQYRVQYPDGSSTSGTYISDVLTINPTPAGTVGSFRFGCSHAVQRPDLFSNTTAGIMSLGRGAQSLSSQTKGTYGNAFSYCVPPTTSHNGFFILGVPRIDASRYLLTPMLKSKMAPSLYLVRLQAIIVAGQPLAVPPMVFAAGAVMDSRTVITRLQPTAYRALRAAFRAQMGAYRVAPSTGQLDTCYDFTGVQNVRLPKISLVFYSRRNGGAAVELDPSGVLFNSCLAFASTGGGDGSTGIIGHVQQRTIEVLYNVGGSAVGFRRRAC